jgi:hypothetical protein
MSRVLKLLLQMDKRARSLNQPLKVLGILWRNRFSQPHLLENIMCFVVSLLIPTMEKHTVIGMLRQGSARRRRCVSL